MIDPVRGAATEARRAAAVDFWTRQGVPADAAQREAPSTQCLWHDGDEILGASRAVDQPVPSIGGRRFWVVAVDIAEPHTSDEAWDALFSATFALLESERREADEGPLGTCVRVTDRAVLHRRQEAIWPTSGLLHAGIAPDGARLRIRYFEDVRL